MSNSIVKITALAAAIAMSGAALAQSAGGPGMNGGGGAEPGSGDGQYEGSAPSAKSPERGGGPSGPAIHRDPNSASGRMSEPGEQQ